MSKIFDNHGNNGFHFLPLYHHSFLIVLFKPRINPTLSLPSARFVTEVMAEQQFFCRASDYSLKSTVRNKLPVFHHKMIDRIIH